MSIPEAAPVQPGEVLDGKYRVDRILGAGGMGVVVAATHVQLQTQVALKFLLPEVLNNPQIVERFVREGRAAVQIHSEHVARVSDVGTLPNGSPYMVMEYLEGQDLGDLLARSGPLSVTQAVGYLLQTCEAVAEAHALGIVHRDLKPANLYLAKRNRREPIIKVLDFGISKTSDAESMGLTKTSAIMGSPYYMSPEQMKSARDADARSDIWALGIIFYELLAGVPPFQGETLTEIIVQVTQGKVPPIREISPGIPVAIEDIIGKCLKRDPRQRYADIAEFAKALAPFGPPRSDIVSENIARILGTVTLSGRPAAAASSEDAANPPINQATVSAWANSRSDTRLRRRVPLYVGAAIIVTVAAGAIVWRIGSNSNRPVASTSPGVSEALPTAPSSTPISSSAIVPAPNIQPEAPIVVTSAVTSAQSLAAAALAPTKKASPRAVTGSSKPPKSTQPASPAPAPATRGLNMGMKE